MTYQNFNQIVASFGIPYAYRTFTKETKRVPPFCVFYYDDRDDVFADNINYAKLESVIIELYTSTKDFALEKKIEDILTENEIAYSKYEIWIDSEKMYEIVYESEVVLNG